MLGQLLNSRYQLIKSLGSTSDSKTYLAEDRNTSGDAACVIRQIHPPLKDAATLEQARHLVAQEVEKLYQLNTTPQIPKLLANFEEKQAFYLVQELIRGTSLKTELEKQQPYTEAEILRFLKESLTILRSPQEKGLIHQDIKPDNWIYREGDGELFLVGWGKIKPLGNDLAATMPINYRCYIAPEQLRNRPQISSDIYSLGVIAVQVLTGIHPINFAEDETGKIIWESHYQGNPCLVPIINQMISPHLKQRYASSREVLAALAQCEPPRTATEVLTSKPSSPPLPTVAYTAPSPPSSVAPPIPLPTPAPIIPETAKLTTENPAPIITPTKNRQEELLNFVKSPTGKVLGICLALGLALVLIMQLWSVRKQRQIAKIVNDIEKLYNDGEYQECASQSNAVNTVEAGVPEVKRIELSSKCVLGLATQQAGLSHYQKALAIAVRIPKISPNYEQAQNYMDDWSLNILQEAEQFYKQNHDLKVALEMIKAIPETSSVKKKALDSALKWREDYQSRPGKVLIDLCQVDSSLCSQ
ncbi:serine/threonine protein kinase [Microcystis aeruginosa NIES-3806]|nr:serine/threonine protein kinase [Microcystis aeruginosa NIES-3806]